MNKELSFLPPEISVGFSVDGCANRARCIAPFELESEAAITLVKYLLTLNGVDRFASLRDDGTDVICSLEKDFGGTDEIVFEVKTSRRSVSVKLAPKESTGTAL